MTCDSQIGLAFLAGMPVGVIVLLATNRLIDFMIKNMGGK
jgi:ABC-type antimicrobial peptide transport system permease subunit